MKRLRKHIARFGHDDRGSPAVEFAFIAPVLMLLVLGIVQFGFVFYTYNEMMNGAREGARRLAVGAPVAVAEARALDTMALDRPYEFDPPPVPGPDAVTMTIRLRMSDAMVITSLDLPGDFYPSYLTASVTMHRE